MSVDQRIQQFKQMAEADPDNELGHFSLGKALIEAGQFAEAMISLERVIQLKPIMSKAYQLLGEAADGAGQRDRAIEVINKGIAVADVQGDVMPRDSMINMLRDWGAPIPAVMKEVTSKAPSTGSGPAIDGFSCSRCGRPDQKLEKAPFKGELGIKLSEHVCQVCWQEWIGMGTKVINELGLSLSSPAGQDAYDQYMVEFLQLDAK